MIRILIIVAGVGFCAIPVGIVIYLVRSFGSVEGGPFGDFGSDHHQKRRVP